MPILMTASLGGASLSLIFLITSLILLALATLGVPSPSRFQFGWAGVFFAVLAIALG